MRLGNPAAPALAPVFLPVLLAFIGCGTDSDPDSVTDTGHSTETHDSGDSARSQTDTDTDTEDTSHTDSGNPTDTVDPVDTGPATDTAPPEPGTLGYHAFASLAGQRLDGAAGRRVDDAGDYDGDGYDDVVIGAHGDQYWDGYRGGVYVAFGPFNGEHLLSDVAVFERGVEDHESLGIDAVGLGDTDGDGISDIAIGTKPSSLAVDEHFYVLCGGDGMLDLSSPCGLVIGNEGEELGEVLVAMGDVDGDGRGDVLTGASERSSPELGAYLGGAYLFHGPVTGTLSNSDADADFIGHLAYESVGWVVAGDGDLNGDGHSEIALGAWSYYGGRAVNGVYVFDGPHAGSNSTADADDTFDGNQGDGWSIAISADFDGDGYDDLVAGLERDKDDDTVAAVFYGGPDGVGLAAGLPEATLEGPAGLAIVDKWGYISEGVGDLDLDGDDELVVASTYDPDDVWLYAFAGPVSGATPLEAAELMLTVSDPEEGNGPYIDVGRAPDLDGDGHEDLLVGRPQWDKGAEDGGGVYLLSGATFF